MTGKVVSHYRVGKKLGEGGMGVVYSGEDINLDRPVALKFLAPHLIQDGDSRKRLIREAKAAASLDHPNICTVFEIDQHEGQHFIAMALIEGTDLRHEIERGPLKVAEALEMAQQIAAGLGEAHAKGIVHRDIKPSNVMLTETGAGFRLVKVMDFGLARVADQSKLTKAETTLGTIAYMSPEQTEGGDIDQRCDIWAVGAVFYEMLTGQSPFRGHYDQAIIYSILNEDPPPVSTVRKGLPPELDSIVARCLQKQPADRYADCRELAADIQRLLNRLRLSETTTYRAVPAHQDATPSGWRTAPALGQQDETAEPSTISPPAALSAEQTRIERKRGVRDVLLQHASQGVLPDRVLTQALQVVSDDPSRENPALQERHEALSRLAAGEVRVGEFVESWQVLNDKEQQTRFEQQAAKKEQEEAEKSGTEYRTDLEIFGLPLVHRTRGKDPITGRRRVAIGVIAWGEIAVGVVALGKIAIGAVTLGWISLGLVAAGGLAVGLGGSLGLVSVGTSPEGVWPIEIHGFGLIPTVLLALLALIAYRFQKVRAEVRERAGDSAGVVDTWQVFVDRDWAPPTAEFYGGTALCALGEIRIDLGESELGGTDVHLETSTFMGHIKIRVAPGTRVLLHGRTVGGRFRDKRTNRAGSSRSPGRKLILDGVAVLGEVTVYDEPFPESEKKRRRQERREARKATREAKKQAKAERKKSRATRR